ncbi:hypothetical protein [Herpetosiphon llansteffanensis]|uniref:hypothetical protein n=1 Tax=Herpetosiphon llansteffanensis TaxID=2094568 RepID=UPI000D7C785D|nr:hypothetical protein [Herpetosiphon llansteffanensis]
MQHCSYCGADVADDWQECATCGWLRDGSLALASPIGERQVACLRCDTALEFRGVKYFHEGLSLAGALVGAVGNFTKRERLEMYVCPNCGSCELFEPELGR